MPNEAFARRHVALPPLAAPRSRSSPALLRWSVRSAWTMLLAYRLRSVLAMLGLVLGVGGLRVVDAFSEYAAHEQRQSLAAAGADLVLVDGFGQSSGGSSGPPSLTAADIAALRALPNVIAASPTVELHRPVTVADRSRGVTAYGCEPDMQRVWAMTLRRGSFITADDQRTAATVVVLGAHAATLLFPDTDPLGQHLRFAGTSFTVKGALKPIAGDLDDAIYMPLSVVQRRITGQATGGAAFGLAYPQIQVRVDSPTHLDEVMVAVSRTLRRSHRVPSDEQDDFAVADYAQIARVSVRGFQIVVLVFQLVDAAVLAIGGFGIAALMLSAVKARTREIGVRVAVGAQPHDVLLQFLAEAATLALVGGTIGLAAGTAAVLLLSRLVPQLAQLQAHLTPTTLALAGAAPVLVGLIFGWYPASRAARLDPIKALGRG